MHFESPIYMYIYGQISIMLNSIKVIYEMFLSYVYCIGSELPLFFFLRLLLRPRLISFDTLWIFWTICAASLLFFTAPLHSLPLLPPSAI